MCPITKSSFDGKCHHSHCWYHGTDRHTTQCVKIAAGLKDTLIGPDLAYLFNISNRNMEYSIQAGREKIECWLRVLSTAENAKCGSHRCSKCGVTRPTQGDCLNKDKCDSRKKIVDKARRNAILSAYFGKISPEQVYAVAAMDEKTLDKIGMARLRRLHLQQEKLRNKHV